MKIDLHVHTSEVSPCGELTCEEVVKLYSAAKYDAIVITNHFSSANKKHLATISDADFFTLYHDTLRHAIELGKENGLLVLGGYELRFDENYNDYLVFGMNEEHCRNCDKLFAMNPESFSTFARENNLLFYQAHPFRNRMTVVKPEYLFGIEVQNSHPLHDSRNDIAILWAQKYDLHQIAGSDCHQIQDVGTSAIITDYEVKDMADLVYVLANDLYRIV